MDTQNNTFQNLADTFEEEADQSFGNRGKVLEFCATDLRKIHENNISPHVLLESWRENARNSAGGLPKHFEMCANRLEDQLENKDYEVPNE
jgi:hypothetical protein